MGTTDRRTFLRVAASAAAGAAIGTPATAAPTTAKSPAPPTIRGVNLGGWLALEKWITPDLYGTAKAGDEAGLCEELGRSKAEALLAKHRETYITEDDFLWLADHGLNAVRIPVHYGIVEEHPPFVRGVEAIEFALKAAKAHGIGVLLDLHGVPGSQNGWDHSGRAGDLGWHTSRKNVDDSIRIVAGLAERFKGSEALIGVELLNEPRWDVPIDVLKGYYRDAYHRVREQLGPGRVVAIHDGFRPFDWSGFLSGPETPGVILDTHMYQCFTEDDRNRDARRNVDRALNTRADELAKMQAQLPCIVGEWSCALDPRSLRGLSGPRLDAALRAFGSAQLMSYESTRGWFFWTYKTAGGGGWSFRDCVANGWLPAAYRG